jgi:hypothetical protein
MINKLYRYNMRTQSTHQTATSNQKHQAIVQELRRDRTEDRSTLAIRFQTSGSDPTALLLAAGATQTQVMHARRRVGLTAHEATPLKSALSVTFLRVPSTTACLFFPSDGGAPDPSRGDSSSGDGGPARCLSSIRLTEASSYESYSELPVS